MGGLVLEAQFFLRGSESRHTLFIVDGLRLNDPTNTDRHFDTAFLFANQYDALQIQRGPSPVLYGGDATSGVIELSPRRGSIEDSSLRQFSLSVGSFNTLFVSGQSDWKANNHQGTFGLMHFKTEGFSRFNKRRTLSDEKDAAESIQFFQASKHRWNDKLQTELYLQGSVSRADQDGFDSMGNPIDTSEDESFSRTLQFIQTTSLKHGTGLSWFKTGINNIKRDIQTLSQGSEFYHGDIRQFQFGKKINQKNHVTVVGLNFDQENYSDKKLDAENDIFSAFFSAEN